jgi:Tol biopolymer transport system component
VDHGSALGAYLVNADGFGVQALSGDAPSSGPSWAPDGSRVAFVTSRGGIIRYVSGGEADVLISFPDGAGVPTSTSWSPDRAGIAFDTYRPTGSVDIWIGPTGGGDARAFISDAASLAWSPDRQRIAFIRPSER